MNFDINLVLVPLTLIFLCVWLWDLFALRQHRAYKKCAAEENQAKKRLDAAKKTLDDRLRKNAIAAHAEEYTPAPTAPDALQEAHADYHAALRLFAEKKAQLASAQEYAVVRWAYEFLPILAFLVVARSFVVEPFSIPSSSMVPTLYTGDFVVVNKAAYGLRLPLLHTKILNTGRPARGDVAVFRYPKNPKIYYIKRVIGVPGDTVRFENGVLSINGKKVDTQAASFALPQEALLNLYPKTIGDRSLSDDERIKLSQKEEQAARYYHERLGERRYVARYVADLNSGQYAPFLQQNAPLLAQSDGQAWQIVVPEGKYFVMGDNRDRSEDSRFWGFVDDGQLAGKATYIWMHKEPGWLNLPSFGRVGKID